MSTGLLVVAYHGCDITTRDDLVSGRLKNLTPSGNNYDWLGPGSYFYEDDLQRAQMFAEASHQNPTRRFTEKPIANPAVVGAILRINSWLDMTTQLGLGEFKAAVDPTREYLENKSQMVANTEAFEGDKDVILRAFDRAVFSMIHSVRDDPTNSEVPYQAVRGAFPQGDPIVSNSGFRDKSHIQIAVRDPNCVRGWFLPKDDELLSQDAYLQAQEDLKKCIARSKKPIVRPPSRK